MYRLVAILFLAVFLSVVGCERSTRQPTYPVKGKVHVNGKPAQDLFIYLHPMDQNNPNAVRPFAQTNENGEFELNSYVTGDGAPVGEFIVTFDWPMKSGTFKNRFEGPDQLRGKYKQPDKSKFRINITKQGQLLETFELSTK